MSIEHSELLIYFSSYGHNLNFHTTDKKKFKKIFGIDKPKNKGDLCLLYKKQLKNAGINYVLEFKMKNQKNGDLYSLFFCTNHPKGIEKMKSIMWKYTLDASEMSFQDNKKDNPQYSLFGNSKEDKALNDFDVFSEMRDFIINKKKISIKKFRDKFLYSDDYIYPLTIINKFIKKLEKEPCFYIDRDGGRKNGLKDEYKIVYKKDES
jgi:hypothetical protein